MSGKIKKNIITIIGVFIGMAGGFLYWKYVGCASGTCPITSNWTTMLPYGALMGGLLGNMVQGFFVRQKPAEKS